LSENGDESVLGPADTSVALTETLPLIAEFVFPPLDPVNVSPDSDQVFVACAPANDLTKVSVVEALPDGAQPFGGVTGAEIPLVKAIVTVTAAGGVHPVVDTENDMFVLRTSFDPLPVPVKLPVTGETSSVAPEAATAGATATTWTSGTLHAAAAPAFMTERRLTPPGATLLFSESPEID
jgi:hypothetical protein